MNKTIGYLRVSKIDQDPEKNRFDVLKFSNEKGFEKVKFVEEKVSGRVSWKKRELKGVVDDLKKGDRLVVPELSRLGRSLIEILEVLTILREKSVNVYSVKEGFQLNGNSIQSKIMATLLGLFAEIERDLISERTKEGLARAREKGHMPGRPKGPGKSKLDPHKDQIVEWLKVGVPKKVIARKLSCSACCLHNFLAKRGLNKIEAE